MSWVLRCFAFGQANDPRQMSSEVASWCGELKQMSSEVASWCVELIEANELRGDEHESK